MFLIKCYSDKANFSEFWSVAPFPLTWKHHFEGKGAWLPGLPGAPNTPKTGVTKTQHRHTLRQIQGQRQSFQEESLPVYINLVPMRSNRYI